LSRFVINIFAVFITPGFVLLFINTDWITKGLSFIRITDAIHIPIVVQFLILEFAIDGLRMASINTPSMLSTPLSVVAAIVLGDYTVSSGWFNSEIMLYMAFVVIANYSQVSFELGYALKFMRILLLILTGVFGIYGFIAGTGILIAAIVCNKSIAGRSYIYPLIPFDGRQLMRRFFRVSLPRSEKEKRV
ncbi:MAG: spore germination protein, partial [Acetivibrio sp.]